MGAFLLSDVCYTDDLKNVAEALPVLTARAIVATIHRPNRGGQSTITNCLWLYECVHLSLNYTQHLCLQFNSPVLP